MIYHNEILYFNINFIKAMIGISRFISILKRVAAGEKAIYTLC